MKLPSTTEMALLEALGAREISGRDLAKRFEKENGRAISYGTLYTTMRRLKDAGWVTVRDDHDDDGRVRFFKICANGLEALKLISDARAMVPGKGVVA